MKVIKWLDEHFEETLLIILLIMISCVQFVQVIVRNTSFIPSLRWAEEFCRFCWIWSVFLSLPYTIRKGSMLRVSVVLDLVPDVVRKVINITVDIITAAALLLLGVHSVTVVQNIIKSGETSPAMVWPMWVVYSVMVVGMFFGTLRALQQTYLHIKNFGEESLSTREQTKKDASEEVDAGRRAEGGKN